MPFADITVNVPLHKTFTYSVPENTDEKAVPGMRVVVPFRNKNRVGYIIGTEVFEKVIPANMGIQFMSTGGKIKEIALFPDKEPVFSSKMIKLLKWISDYYCAPIGEVFAAATPNVMNSVKEIEKTRRDSKKLHGFDAFHKTEEFKLNIEQDDAWEKIQKTSEEGFSTTLIHGVTGSGKTELYLRLIDKIIAEGKDVVLLVPEISLIPQLAGRVFSYLRKEIAIYHSGLTDVQRLNQWEMIKSGKVKVVVGTRSAIFAPFNNLGAIIVDEEHDNSYKQDESPRYNARDAAIMRGKIEKIPVVLGSATPSIESLYNAKNNKYKYIRIKERHGESTLPEIVTVDMRKEIKSNLLNPYLSVLLMGDLKKVVKKGQQAILFLNRRGYANFFVCRDCGFIPECPNCKITLTYHKRSHSLKCHYCDYKITALDSCPKCNSLDLEAVGSGTEMVEEVIGKRLPNARIARLDRDTITTDKKRREILTQMKEGKIDILIGTQMVTKGHDFPNVTLVGIVSADQSIHFPDFRAGERTFQLLTQVSGRAGRALHPGKVIVQTYNPEHLSIVTASQNKLDDFLGVELSARKDLFYPPFSRLANIKITGNSEARVVQTSKLVSTLLKKCSDGGIRLLGPAPAPLAMIKGKTRWQLLIKSPSAKRLASTLAQINRYLEDNPQRGIQISIDVDPVSTM